MGKNFLNLIFFVIILLACVWCIIYVTEKAEDINKLAHENPNVDFYYYCPDHFISAYYNCGDGLTYENLTGEYCNGTLICENEYKLK